ncbi:glycoside hydrolase family 13 protein [Chitinimonas sp. BJB300]|uniref:glycoside hydrolase family 13 protein n=1 Tax=Chitinimonas sp. BJB300 TaxID=1559339 RepID=UPI000C0EFBD9|nr:glycoside hydrolase family 13 protein [Chitinimonas sp. BJB300]PHV11967.1 cyclomaltodextrinase [Chitinimonas sp. BJB300]TSJ87269.1 cyclomaltodextrinase [Chitinimonas sp. BJB300]
MKTAALDAFTRKTASQVVYQIFPERFAIGGGLSSSEKLAHPAYAIPGVHKRGWDEPTLQQPWGNQFYGGDLDGIADKLDYLTDLGITGVYLTPVFTAPSNHKYDATDFFSIDPMFGGEPALKRLTDALHARGMTLTLDAVLNHVSDQHPWFLAAKAGDPDKRDWFTFDAKGDALCWQDYGMMPELNLANPAVRDVMYRQPKSLVQHWLAKGVDNWRFDVAQDVGIPFAQEMANAVAKHFPDTVLLGELNGFSASWFEAPGGFHGMMNYWYRTATLAWLAGEIDAVQMNAAVRDAREGYGLKGLLCSWNMLSSHDTPRLITTLGSAAKARTALLMQMTLPGVPLVYYGEEIGMQGGADPDCRRPMRWNEAEWDPAQRSWVKQLIAIRQTSPALQYGDVIVLGDRLPGNNALVFLRHTEQPGEAALVVVNESDKPLQQKLLLPYSHWYDGVPLKDALGNAPDIKVQAASIQLSIPAHAASIYQASEPYQHYTFFKPRNRL